MNAPLLPQLRTRLAHHPAAQSRASRRAAVAVVLRESVLGEELLFIHRAEHPQDPWSGHMAFPGGMVDPGDATPLAAALRETREELGLDLARDGELLGRLSDVSPRLLLGALGISPFVFALRRGEVFLTPNEEVQAALWIPLAYFGDPHQRSTFFWSRSGAPVPMPCYRWDGKTIWGLTLRVLDELLEIAAPVAVP